MSNQYDDELTKKAALIWVAFIMALTLAFIILKLVAVITWSWGWILAPLWIPMGLSLIINVLKIKPPGQ